MTSQMRRGDHTALPAVLIGTGIWLVALIVVSITAGMSAPENGVWWWGVCLVGLISGLIGLVFLRWRRSRLMRSGRID